MIFFVLFWLLLFGGAVGSFLNVVIYRLPAGLSLSYPPSRCPKCEHPIRPRDNFPVFGWILLRGKCRDCKSPISVRYPLIEGLCAILFVTVGYAVLVNRSLDELEQSLGLIVCYLLLLTTLLAAGMIEYDGKKVPIHLFVPAFFGALILPALSWDAVSAGAPLFIVGLSCIYVLAARCFRFRIYAMLPFFLLTWGMVLLKGGWLGAWGFLD
ncbi:MAG: prepilin peptidase [Planctomycetaceae bacterium]|nr:prepilin peptidase [Planctomycetaceae bacterium]